MSERKPLPIATPEEEGISSRRIINMVNALCGDGMNMHSYILIRHGKILSEGYFAPFNKDMKHRMYSVSKTFVSAAIGLLYTDGRIKLDDKIVSFFPEKVTESTHPDVMEMTIRDLLMMSTAYNTCTYTVNDDNWIDTFFTTPPTHPAGTVYTYDTSASYILNVIVERLTGKPFIEYLKEKILDEIGFSEDSWCVQSPEGNSWGGSGVMCTSRDLAKFALLWMNGGKWEGKQLISEDYVKAATSRQIDNCITGWRDGAIYGYGYGYQIWIIRDNAFLLNGMGSQFAVCIPEKDIVFVTTGDTQGSERAKFCIFDNLWNEIVYPAADEAMAADEDAYRELCIKNENLLPPVVPGEYKLEESERKYGGRRITIVEGNPMKLKEARFTFDGDGGTLEYRSERGEHKIEFGFGYHRYGEFPETHYFAERIKCQLGHGYKYSATAAWTEPHKLVIRVFAIDDYFGNITMTFSFKDNKVGIYMFKIAEWFFDEYNGFAEGLLI